MAIERKLRDSVRRTADKAYARAAGPSTWCQLLNLRICASGNQAHKNTPADQQGRDEKGAMQHDALVTGL